MKSAPVIGALAGAALFLSGGIASAVEVPDLVGTTLEMVGAAPVIDAPGADAVPSLLGTAFRLHWCHVDSLGDAMQYESLVQPTSVTTAGMTEDSRLVRVTVKFRVISGALVIDPADFVLLDENGVRYPTTTPEPGEVDPMVKSVALPEAGTIEQAFFVSVPIRNSGLLIGYDPSPADELIGTWTLSAP